MKETTIVSNEISKKIYRKTVKKIRELSTLATAACKDSFPIGSTFTYRHGRHVLSAIVVAHTYSERLKVRGRTNREYWIDGRRWEGLE